ncbi:MAG: hypothetical protein ACRDKV_10835 [Solirubrobacterales bacterium]
MSELMTTHTWITRTARRTSSSSGARVHAAHFAPAPKARASAQREILDLLGHVRPQAHLAMEALI